MTEAATRSGRVFDLLRADIISGSFLPGQRLAFEVLRARYGVSMGVLREVLSRLEATQLVTSEPGLGFRVIELSQEDLGDLTEARCELETLVLRRAFTDGDLGWESNLVAAFHVLDRTPVHEVGEAISATWLNAHSAFHMALLAGCGNSYLADLATSLRDRAELYRNWCHPPFGEEEVALEEHRGLLHAALDRDAESGARILAVHIGRTNRAIRNWCE